MKNKIIIGLVLGIFLVGLVSAVDEIPGVSYCCEKTKSGAWCQNAPFEKCDESFRKVPTSCEATSYCRMGTCYDSQEGTCMENTPQKVCDDNGGVWAEGDADDIPQCQLGCCLIGDQAAFVTQTRCKRLSSVYGLEIDFRTNIGSELQCIASATSDVKGACVFEREYERTCKFISKKECSEIQVSSGNSTTEFHEGTLCSDESLGTNCGPTEQTTCVDGKDGVYFLDSCGNLGNIYDSSKIKDKNYWGEVYDVSESCGFGEGNSDPKNCGNCDYFLGSTCKKFSRGEDSAKPNYGNFICHDLSCEYHGEKYEHGETWCADVGGIEESLPGSRHFRLVCYNGDVTVEPCADFRQELCLQDEVNGFSTAACIVNKWQDCLVQEDQKDCENIDRRDCQWIEAEGSDIECVPMFAPGFDFWNVEGESDALCSRANTQCVVQYEKKLGGKPECVENCECLEEDWEDDMNKMCINIGDCGAQENFVGTMGYRDENPIEREDVDDD